MKKTKIPIRYLFVVFTFGLALLLYIDRVCISVAKDSISKDLDISDQAMGWVFAIFAFGYALGQLPAGTVIDKFGPRKVLTSIVAIWSAFTAFTGLTWNWLSLSITQFFFGIGEAGAFPGISRSVFSWIPLNERGIVTGVNFSGSRLGAAFAYPLLAVLMVSLGWRYTFILFGVVGLLWALAWYIFFRDMPEQHKLVSDDEKKYIITNRQSQVSSTDTPSFKISSIFSSTNVWLAMWQYMSSNFIFYFCLMWFFPYLKKTYNLTYDQAGFLMMAPFLAGALGNYVSGFFVDFIYKKGKWALSRRLPAIVGFCLVTVGVLNLPMQTSAVGAVAWLALAIFGADMTLSPSWSFCIDIGKKNSGMVSSTMNMAGNLMAAISMIVFPIVMNKTGSPNIFFYVAAVVNILAAIGWLFMNPEKPLIKE